jgi:hypothetical protein
MTALNCSEPLRRLFRKRAVWLRVRFGYACGLSQGIALSLVISRVLTKTRFWGSTPINPREKSYGDLGPGNCRRIGAFLDLDTRLLVSKTVLLLRVKGPKWGFGLSDGSESW